VARSALNRVSAILLPYRLFVGYLSFWARLVLRARRPLIIGITGSVGKSTTTQMLADVLMHPAATPRLGLVGSTCHNMNNDIGVPLTVLRYDRWITDDVGRFLMIWSLPFRAARLAIAPTYPRILILEYGAGPPAICTAWLASPRPPSASSPPSVRPISSS
jgi:hypothetical protein